MVEFYLLVTILVSPMQINIQIFPDEKGCLMARKSGDLNFCVKQADLKLAVKTDG